MDPQAAAVMLGKVIKKAVDKDRANRYVLDVDMQLRYHFRVPGIYFGRLVKIEPDPFDREWCLLTFFAPGECDGATGVPDGPRGVVEAALAHDPLYIELDQISSYFGWTQKQARAFADGVFAAVLAYYDSPVLQAYGRGVRPAGFWFTKYKAVRRWLRIPLACLALCCMTSCGGCGIFDPLPTKNDIEFVNPPHWHQTAGGARHSATNAVPK